MKTTHTLFIVALLAAGNMRAAAQTNEVVPVWALDVQQMLWDNYQNNKVGMGSGISAMPSMHVATATLMALFGWQYSRIAGIVLTLYALVIFIGSVHLGWHYALDGYVGALGAALVWWLVGRWQVGTERQRLPARSGLDFGTNL